MADTAELSQLTAAVQAEAQRSPAPALSPGLEAALARLGSWLWGKIPDRPVLALAEATKRELARLVCAILPPYFAPAAALAEHPVATAGFARSLLFIALNYEPARQRAAHALLDKLAAQADRAVATRPSECVELLLRPALPVLLFFSWMPDQCDLTGEHL